MCNCCQPILCPANAQSVDTDDNGCDDACMGAAGETWQVKTCGQLGGTWVQDGAGTWECQVGLGAPCQCGQVCDGAVLTGPMCPG